MASGTKRHTQLDLASTSLLRKQEDGRSKNKASEKPKVSAAPNVVRKDRPQQSNSSLVAARTRQEHMPVAVQSPLKHYKANFKLKFGDSKFFMVAEKLTSQDDNDLQVIIKPLLEPDVSDKTKYIQRIRDASFVSALKVFKEDDISYVVFEFMPISLSEIAGNPLLDERRLASILRQVSTSLRKYIGFCAHKD